MKYKCLVLDHDDTVVNSTETIHYPAFMNSLATLRPDIRPSLDEHLRYNFDPGFASYCYDILGFTEEEMTFQVNNWLSYVKKRIPKSYPGIRRLLTRFHEAGGYLCVVSHSMKENILRDYAANGLPTPKLVFGWELSDEKRKPSVWPLQEIMRRLSLQPCDLVMIDDLKPGKDMADAAGVDFIGAGWSHQIPEIADYMRAQCAHYCTSVEELETLLFDN